MDISFQTRESIPGSCTTLAVSRGEKVFFGNNEDFNNPVTFLWTVSPGEGSYGGVYFGYAYGSPQGGINEKGLAFDALALPKANLNPNQDLPFRGRSDTQFLGMIMDYNATVDEAIAYAQGFDWGESLGFQVLLADASGEAVIISAGSDGNLAFTRKAEGDGHLVGTNFNRANPENRFGSSTCWRYEKAESMLAQIEVDTDLNVGYLGSILDAIHVEGAEENTLYSNIFDLKNGLIYLYYWHQYDEVVTLSVREQMNNGLSTTKISKLFSEATVVEAAAEHERYIKQAERELWLNQNGKLVIAAGLLMIIFCFFSLLVFMRNRRKKRIINLTLKAHR